MKTAVFILGSEVDKPFAAKITAKLDELNVEHEVNVASAHKTPLRVLEILQSYENEKGIVFITLAGRSNALSGFCGANTPHPVIACPPFADKADMMVNINSTLQMPSNTPVLTVLDPGNAALCAAKILNMNV